MPTLLLTRPERQSRSVLDALAVRGLRPSSVVSPVIEISIRDVALPPGAELILTSQNAVSALPEGRWTAWCVGDTTADAAREAGLEAISAGGDVTALESRLLEARPRRLIHVRGFHAAGGLVSRLRDAGVQADEVIAYDQLPRALSPEAARLLAGDGAVVLPLYSPRSAALVSAHEGPWHASLEAVAISAATAGAFDRRARLRIATEPTGDAMLDAIAAALHGEVRSRLVDGDGAG
jgi:uroporphyrinogen-III synthase